MNTNCRNCHACAHWLFGLCVRCCTRLCIHCDERAIEHVYDNPNSTTLKCLYDSTEFTLQR